MTAMASTDARQLRDLKIRAQPLTAEAFAPYGRVMSAERVPLEMRDGHFTANIAALGGVPQMVRGVNRHMDHSQLFVPMNGARTLVVVAPRDQPADSFDADTIVAFVADGSVAYTFDAGTWHIEPKALDEANCHVINVQTDVYKTYPELIHLDEACAVRLSVTLD